MLENTDRIFLSPRARATILWVAVAVAVLFLWQVHSILTPFIWAIITAYVLNPVVVFLSTRTGLPRRLWAIVFYLVLLGLLIWGLGTLVPQLSRQLTDFIREVPAHAREAGRIARESGLLSGNTLDILGTEINLNASDAEISRQLQLLVAQQLGRSAIPAIARGAEGLLKLLVYLVATFFLLLEMERIGDFFARITPDNVRSELGPWVRRINHVLGAYIRGQLILVVLMSTASYIALTLLDVKYAPLLAIFTGLVETMPFIGPYTAGGTAVLVALTQGYAPFGWSPMYLGIAVAITYTVLRQLEDNFVMPFLIGRLVHLHPLIVIFAVLAGAASGGILGLLLAVPVAATVKIVITYLNAKLREEPSRALVVIDRDSDWSQITASVRQGVFASKANGAARPYLIVSVPYPPYFLIEPTGFHRLQALLEESSSDAVLLTSDPALLHLADQAGIATQEELPPVSVSAPPPDYQEAEPANILTRMIRKGGDEREAPKRGGLFVTRPLGSPKEIDEDPHS